MDNQTSPEFGILHAYRRLVRRGLASAMPLLCQTCGEEYLIGLDNEDHPLLKCFTCASVLRPGLAFYDRLAAVVEKH